VSMRRLAKIVSPVVARYTGLSSALALRYRGMGAIFALHSIVPDDEFYPDETLRCSTSKLVRTLLWLQKKRIAVVSLNEAVQRLSSDRHGAFVAFTFDDGYADNFTRALPIMERFGAPFTVYVTTGMVTRSIDAWWFGLAALIRGRTMVALPGWNQHFVCPDRASKKRTFSAIESAVHRDFSLLPQLRATLKASNIDYGPLVDREALTTQQLQRLARHPLVTIGGHTSTHRNLAETSSGDASCEMAENRKFLETVTERPVEHFAYPFGHARACGEREAEICRSLGFQTAVTTRHGALFAEHAQHLHALPRIHLAMDDTPSTLHCKLNGVYRAFHSRLGNPVAHM
jgi:peptidoglycan/xylan/chitin deacetylase (PgdA/CDA1 family)